MEGRLGRPRKIATATTSIPAKNLTTPTFATSAGPWRPARRAALRDISVSATRPHDPSLGFMPTKAEGRRSLTSRLTRRGRPPRRGAGPQPRPSACSPGGDPTGATCSRLDPTHRAHRLPLGPCAPRSVRGTGQRLRGARLTDRNPTPRPAQRGAACFLPDSDLPRPLLLHRL